MFNPNRMKVADLPQNKKIILFDGDCHLCDKSVQFILKKDFKDLFRFVSLQSDLGKSLLQELQIPTQNIDSIILILSPSGFLIKSKAVLHIVKSLGIPYTLLGVFNLFPTIVLDKLYDYIAQRRIRWFGIKQHCMLPTPALKDKFLA
jgi:predicted DCC family thiol-disulfide oxidoreductase YuxK